MKRKLTTILYADGVGFGARMEADEAATLDSLRRARAVMRALFDDHDGREVNTWGDAVIAEFASVVEAVRCAVAIQEALESASRGADELRFRIGVNLGDVMIDGENLFGDGVNVAERLQSLAEPGGVMVSGAVRDLAHKQLAFGFDFAGEQHVKSLEEPVSTWRLRRGGANAEADPAPPPPPIELNRAERGAAGAFAWVTRALNRWGAWYLQQPRKVRRAAGMIAVFFTINALFTGIATPWFVFPSIPFALYVWRHRDPKTFPWQHDA
ncbi:MAG: adenylate/guanylate cyclase domain-containing protein [Pseudomonadota bacterium]